MSWIDPDHFIERMEEHWTKELGNVSSGNLRRVWGQIAHFFRVHIFNHGTPEDSRWHILSPPTGSGKTESTVLYSAMLSDLPPEAHPGVLIVTRLIADAELLAERINRFGTKETAEAREGRYAVAFHSESPLKLDDLKNYPVLVITHRAYELALDRVGEARDTFKFFHEFRDEFEGGTRKLVVVDECLDIVEHSQVSLDGLREALGRIPQFLRDRHPEAIQAIEFQIELFEQIHQKQAAGAQVSETMLIKDPVTVGVPPDLRPLIHDFAHLSYPRGADAATIKRIQSERQVGLAKLKALHNLFPS